MRIDLALAELIARVAIAEPYRQIEVLTTRDFTRWLKERDIDLPWETLHHLWGQGVLHPVAVLEPALAAGGFEEGRFVQLDLAERVPHFVDLGVDVTPTTSFTHRRKLPSSLAESLLWHPFQLWSMAWLARTLSVNISLSSALAGPEAYAKLAGEFVTRVPERLVEFAGADRHHTFLRVLALLLAAEPLVHTAIDSTVRLRPRLGEYDLSLAGYYRWVDSQDGAHLLSSAGLPVETVEEWHREIAISAEMVDPLAHFRILFRHIARDKRERLEGKALRAHTLYDTAEVLRRYLERYHGRELLEEDDVRYGPQSPAAKARLYGAPRTADFDRTVFRRIAREFDVDPQARTTWFLEGATERGFVERLAAREHIDLVLNGIEIMDLEGVGGLASNRFRALLERFRREEVFAYVSIDREHGGKHLGLLRKYAADGLLPAGFTIWEPDFESANYTLAELAGVANTVAAENGVAVTITAQDIQLAMRRDRRPAGEAIKQLWRAGKFYGGKGEAWGAALADWAIDHPCPVELADKHGDRPNAALISLLLTGQRSHYQLTADEFMADSLGRLVEKAR